MFKKNIQTNLSTFLNFILALVFAVAAAMIVFLVNYNMRKQALMEAESKARIILDLNLATHTYFSQQLKPKVFKVTDTLRSDDYFEPTWMSSTYAIREIYKLTNTFNEMTVRLRGEIDTLEGRVQERTVELKQVNDQLEQDISKRKHAEEEREKLIKELREALAKIKTLSGMLPICSSCKKIRDDNGYWNQIEVYIRDHSEAEFTHGICPECFKKLYPDESLEDL